MLSSLTVAIASGKGGTGKTTVSSNLARAASQAGCEVCYVDCDVEEPNGHLFLKPRITGSRHIHVPVPAVDEEKCTSLRPVLGNMPVQRNCLP